MLTRILKANAAELACPCSGKPLAPQLASENKIQKTVLPVGTAGFEPATP
jgi:hypothetical protein